MDHNIISIHLFAGLAERLRTSVLQFPIQETGITVEQLKLRLCESYADASQLISISFVAVNQQYATKDTMITPNDEVALIPPVSGGDGTSKDTYSSDDGLYTITSLPLSVEEISKKVITANHGATLSFIGTTREMTGELRTVYLEYEAYIPMALSMMQQIGDEIEGKWPGTRIAIGHRIGKVDITEISVVIAVSSPHRSECYEASRYAIDRLKHIVPIWKKEIWDDGSEWQGHQLGPWDPTASI
ncbi:molybdenum cofactor biosynthesis protein MoaE [Paenibacillus sediminis]|uniref:Molybdopterin synthase catalytic subunit n=1 Tax=Paenibacillus sediminis TaxID=664909 RepID=A0ABS4H5U0_9BACL|nr:molybdenum cofactor biosynthesis protein MoaE [Paenibacillus sediminis]MBP1937836.1 molybdopterin synthase catalytic subunit [Paenibacillus sediminis]